MIPRPRDWVDEKHLKQVGVNGSTKRAFRRVEREFLKWRPPQEKTTWKAPKYTR
jgi:hypothetical protein